jgi:glutathione S-transferase
MSSAARPILWHLNISHYSEKVRWALDYKGVDAERRMPQPGLHMGWALVATRGRHKTLPVMRFDGGRHIGDSTAIIAELERRHPDPPLYPSDAEERARALDLEDWFDENLAPPVRQFVWYEATHDPRALQEITTLTGPPWTQRVRGLGTRVVRGFTSLRYRAGSDEMAQESRRRVLAGIERLEEELGDAEYLVGERFTVADLTAAAILYPIVLPAEAPQLPAPPAGLARLREEIEHRRAFGWVADMFARYRSPALTPRPVSAR